MPQRTVGKIKGESECKALTSCLARNKCFIHICFLPQKIVIGLNDLIFVKVFCEIQSANQISGIITIIFNMHLVLFGNFGQ